MVDPGSGAELLWAKSQAYWHTDCCNARSLPATKFLYGLDLLSPAYSNDNNLAFYRDKHP